MITLHHAQGTAMSADIHEMQFDGFKELESYFKSLSDIDDEETVYLLTEDDVFGNLEGSKTHLFISESIFFINKYLKDIEENIKWHRVVFLQEYKSYEDAYRVALSMRENSALCYME